jgi:hypothetical protein
VAKQSKEGLELSKVSPARTRVLIGILVGLGALLAIVLGAHAHFTGPRACGEPVSGTITENRFSDSYSGTRMQITATLETGRSVRIIATPGDVLTGQSYLIQQFCHRDGHLTGFAGLPAPD